MAVLTVTDDESTLVEEAEIAELQIAEATEERRSAEAPNHGRTNMNEWPALRAAWIERSRDHKRLDKQVRGRL
jgi:hypothetical protein